MGWFDGFPFKNRQQVEKERKAYEKKIFPLGVEAQRDAARRVLEQILPPKTASEQALFAFVCAKDAYLNAAFDEEQQVEPHAAAQKELAKQKWLTEAGRQAVLALIDLEKDAPSLEEYPTAAQVRELLQLRNGQ